MRSKWGESGEDTGGVLESGLFWAAGSSNMPLAPWLLNTAFKKMIDFLINVIGIGNKIIGHKMLYGIGWLQF